MHKKSSNNLQNNDKVAFKFSDTRCKGVFFVDTSIIGSGRLCRFINIVEGDIRHDDCWSFLWAFDGK